MEALEPAPITPLRFWSALVEEQFGRFTWLRVAYKGMATDNSVSSWEAMTQFVNRPRVKLP